MTMMMKCEVNDGTYTAIRGMKSKVMQSKWISSAANSYVRTGYGQGKWSNQRDRGINCNADAK